MNANITNTLDKAVEQLAFIREEMREHFVCLSLDAENRVIACRVISIGTLTASLVHPREVFVEAIVDRAASIIVGHNHPSGSLDISEADVLITRRLREAGRILGIEVIWHIIMTVESYTSIDVG